MEGFARCLVKVGTNRLAPCIHEAGHAAVAELLGMRIVYMQTSEDGSGVTTPSPVGSVHLTGAAGDRRQIQIAVAGTAAEVRYCDLVGYPDDPGFHPMHGRHGDGERAWRAAQSACNGDLNPRASDLEPWHDIEPDPRSEAEGYVQNLGK